MGARSASSPGDDNLYEALGVSPDASEQDIAKAYRRLARAHHPDANPDALADDFTAATDAYDVLRDPDRRRAYDTTRRTRAAAADAAAGMRIPVRRITGRDSTRASSSDTVSPAAPSRSPGEVLLPLTFDQAALGTTAVIEVGVASRCEACAGSGRAAPSMCSACSGAGFSARNTGGITIRYACSQCEGTGQRSGGPCRGCRGGGQIVADREVTLQVPPGVEDGTRLRFAVPGDSTRQMTAVVRSGAHPYFGRRGRDLTLQLPITLAEAALGGVVTVPTLRSAVAIRIPPGTPHGRTFRIRGQGVPDPAHPGDLLVTVQLVIPAELNDDQRTALQAFAAATESPRKHLEGPT
jgi:molecular chaperone DnaJ